MSLLRFWNGFLHRENEMTNPTRICIKNELGQVFECACTKPLPEAIDEAVQAVRLSGHEAHGVILKTDKPGSELC